MTSYQEITIFHLTQVKNMLATIKIKDLKLRTFIGINPEEIENKQDVTVNIEFQYNASTATSSDDMKDAQNYRTLTKKVIHLVEERKFYLLEKLAQDVLSIFSQEESILFAEVEIDKPHALRFAESVSISLAYHRSPQEPDHR